LPPRLDWCRHTVEGFEWSYPGAGPAQLALAILADVLGDDERAPSLHQAFMVAKIVKLDRDPAWSITKERVLKWVQEQRLPPSENDSASADRAQETGASCRRKRAALRPRAGHPLGKSSMRILDIDLDFFLNEVAYFTGEGRRSNDYLPWNEQDVRSFLEDRCHLVRGKRVKGRYIARHHEAFFFWRELLQSGQLQAPFEVIHIDAHADLGMGDSGYIYLMTEVLHWDVAQRAVPEAGSDELNEGNYLAFAIACRWISRLTYVAHPRASDDLMWLHFKDFEPRTGILQLRPCTMRQLDKYLPPREKRPRRPSTEPEVPFVRISGDAFSTVDPFSFVVLCHSHDFTPPASDALVPVIREYIEEI
jgi:hypothetical protein